jgi:carboxyl-terminal processing protease
VQPDIRLPSAISPTEVGESSRDAALPWNRIRPTRYKPDGTLTPLIPDLQSRHDQRAAADPGFQHAVAEIAAIERMRSERAVSLNLETRRAERASLSETQLARENERRTAVGDEPLEDATDIENLPDAMLNEAAEITADLTQIEPSYVARSRPAG